MSPVQILEGLACRHWIAYVHRKMGLAHGELLGRGLMAEERKGAQVDLGVEVVVRPAGVEKLRCCQSYATVSMPDAIGVE